MMIKDDLEDLLNEGEEREKEARNKYHREYRAKMSIEQKEARNQYRRKYYANMTEEQKAVQNQHQRERRSNMTEKTKISSKTILS